MTRKPIPTVRYRALAGLSYPTNPTAINRIVAGEDVPFEERAIREVEAGEIVSDIPAVSIPWLLEQGCIEVVTDATPAEEPSEEEVGDGEADLD